MSGLSRKVLLAGALFGAALGGCSDVPREPLDHAELRAESAEPIRMLQRRRDHSATVLADGRVLVCGGIDERGAYLDTCEFYDRTSPAFASAPSMPEPRVWFTLSMLGDSSVLATGGLNADGTIAETAIGTSEAWSRSEVVESRYLHTATPLPDGSVLVVGGASVGDGTSAILGSAELRHPNGEWEAVEGLESMGGPSYGHTATPFAEGADVLITGGTDERAVFSRIIAFSSTTRRWTWLGTLRAARTGHTATLLEDGSVLLVGGEPAAGLEYPLPERISAFGVSRLVAPIAGRAHHAAALLGRQVIVAGGIKAGESAATREVAVYDPDHDSWSFLELNQARSGFTLSRVDDHTLLASGGQDGAALASAELIQLLPSGADCESGSSCASARCVDEVCCESLCEGTCERCDLAGARGTCTALDEAEDAVSECGADAICKGGECVATCASVCTGPCEECNAEGECVVLREGPPVRAHASCEAGSSDAGCAPACRGDGSRCTPAAAGLPCGAESCDPERALLLRAGRCDGRGQCEQEEERCEYGCERAGKCLPAPGLGERCDRERSCPEPWSCVDGVCCAEASCGAGRSCALAEFLGECKKLDGVSCAADSECGSQHCVAGFCCESACDGACTSCAVPEREGSCETERCEPVVTLRCAHTVDCGTGLVCDPDQKLCVPDRAGGPESGGCTLASQRAGRGQFVVLALLGLARARRRTRRAPGVC